MPIHAKYTQYATDVLEGKITAGVLIKKACERYMSFLERNDMYFDCAAVDRVVNFVSKLKHFTGEFAGQPFKLLPWQFWIVCSLFGFKWRKDDTRVTRTAMICVGRKNGKSTFLGALSAYAMVADKEPAAQCVFSANSTKQAKLCFDITRNFLEGLDPQRQLFKTRRDRIEFPLTKSEIIVTSSDASKLDGLNLHYGCVDELEEAKSAALWNVLETSMGMRRQPLILAICTAGFDVTSFCYTMRQSYIDVLNGVVDEPSMFGAIYELDEGDDVENEAVWLKANPSLGQSVKPEFLRQQLNRSKHNTALRSSVMTKLFNFWLHSASTWIPSSYILDAQKKWELSDHANEPAYIGIDLANCSDLTVLTVMCDCDDGIKRFRTWYFLPSAALSESANAEKYKIWATQGFLTITDGNVTDYSAVMRKLMQLNSQMYIYRISYDAWSASQFAIDMAEQNLPCYPYSMSITSITRPSREIERLIRGGFVEMYPNPIDAWCWQNARAKTDYNENIRPVKESADQKIDGVLGQVLALGACLDAKNISQDPAFIIA